MNNTIIGLLFISACIFGITLALWPNWLRAIKKKKMHDELKPHISNKDHHRPRRYPPKRQGHHPVCHNFYGHAIQLGEKVVCAGCFGLSLGAISAIIFMIFFIIYEIRLSNVISYLLILTGFLIILVNFFEIQTKSRDPVLHVMLNFLLIIGFFFIIISVFHLTKELFIGILAIILSILWLDTTIQLSNSHHKKICNTCPNQNCFEQMS
jgi:hypothetical protein